jgi:hypothetical protein
MIRDRLQAIFKILAHRTFFVFKDKMRAADDGPLAFDQCGNAVGNDIFDLRMHFFMDEMP